MNMKMLYCFCILAQVIFIACSDANSSGGYQDSNGGSDGDSIAPPSPPIVNPIHTVNVYDSDDKQVTVPLTENTLFCTMATWCPHSKDLVNIFNNPEYGAVLNKFNICFLFDKKEIKSMIARVRNDPKSVGFEPDQVDELIDKLGQMEEVSNLMYPEMLSDLPEGSKYYFFDTDLNYEIDGFPNALDLKDLNSGFSTNPIAWIYKRFPENNDLIARMIEDYNGTKNN